MQVSNLIDTIHSSTLLALIDTGADSTLVPAYLPNQLQIPPTGRVLIQAYKGPPERVSYYDVSLRIGDLRLVGLSVITFSADYILLGRDVLNHLRLLLDGPAQMLDLLD